MIPFLVFGGLLMGAQDLPPGGTLTLDQALAYADKNAFAILLQQTRVEKQRQETAASQGQLGPKLGVAGNYTRYDQATSASFGSQTFTILPIQQLSGTATAGLPIDLSGNMRRLVRASKSYEFAQQETLQADRADTRRAVRSAYYAILRAQAQLVVAQETLDSDSANVKNVDQRFKAGIVAQVDLLRAQTQEAQSESNLIAAKNNLQIAKQNLNSVLARPIEDDFKAEDVQTPALPTTDPKVLTADAENNRHEAKALENTVHALGEIRRATEQGNAPNLNLSLGYTDSAKPIGFGQRPQVVAGVIALNFPIFDSGVTRANVKAARQDEAQAKVQLSQVRLEISLEVSQATTNLQNALARMTVADRQVSTAKIVLSQANLRLQQGVGIMLEVIDAQRDLTTAEYNQVAARYDVLQAIADLQRAVGDDSMTAK